MVKISCFVLFVSTLVFYTNVFAATQGNVTCNVMQNGNVIFERCIDANGIYC